MQVKTKKYLVTVQCRCRKSFDLEAADADEAEQIASVLFKGTSIAAMDRADIETDSNPMEADHD